MKKYKISILSHNLSTNCLGRAYILAKVLADEFDVEIVGPVDPSGIWSPVAHDTTIRYIKLGLHSNLFSAMKHVDGDIVYAVKPRTFSFGLALLAKVFKKKKIILDIDDWEIGFAKDSSVAGLLYNVFHFWNPNSVIYTWLLEVLIPNADAITTSNYFLQNKYGGTLIPHFRDTNMFNPAIYSHNEIKTELGVENKKIVMFSGTIDRYKGVDTLISGFDKLNRSDVALVLIGVDDKQKKLLPKRSYLKVVGRQSFEDIPRFIAAADIIALMQKQNSTSTLGQLPAKMFDAMAMEKPIIATAVSDIPKILKGCGLVINDSPDELAKAITYLLDNPEEAKKMGVAARKKCVDEYSEQVMKPRLAQLFRSLL